ncbi:CoA transferase, partial [Enterobacter hormaechei]|uniref:CoA transferase n=1 Tax=Enterobacter hormaechei TaxID=158836 RepID=UPI001952F3C3
FKADPLGDISTALGIDHLGKDPRFATFADQVANKQALQGIFCAHFKSGSTAHWLARLEAQDLLCAPVK